MKSIIEPVAHSPRKKDGKVDLYARHVQAVCDGAVERAKAMLCYAGDAGLLHSSIRSAGLMHDLGKLDPENQKVLLDGRGRLPWDHIDAGVAYLRKNRDFLAAWLVRAHHAPGLPKLGEHFQSTKDRGRQLRGRRHDNLPSEDHNKQIDRTNDLLSEYLKIHEQVLGIPAIKKNSIMPRGLKTRLALSCLVDADHADTAFFVEDVAPVKDIPCRWEERLQALCSYVASLPKGDTEEEKSRNKQREVFFQSCLESSRSENMVACEGPVGLGKTTAVTAYLLKQAYKKKLRRLIIVAPFTAILSQTAKVLRKALVLPGENPEEIVAEHHHRADFSSYEARQLAALWHAPIVLTTAVSFFETLSSASPSTLRKLHAVPGSALFFDEAHAAIPVKLWPQNWRWLKDLVSDWGCSMVFASGSLSRFWTQEAVVGEKMDLPELMQDTQLKSVLRDEQRRICYRQLSGGSPVTVQELIDAVVAERGPRLVILNTVKNAAMVAQKMRERKMDVLHLSTALTPYDRKIVLQRIERKLLFSKYGDWTLVATSCVEAGVDFSFFRAFRERFSVASLLQTGGRVNRHGEYNDKGGGIVFDFTLSDIGITQHPDAEISAEILLDFLKKDLLNIESPADLVTKSMHLELQNYSQCYNENLLIQAEKTRNFPEVEKLGKVISADTRFVVIDPLLQVALQKKEKPGMKRLLEGSVQLWTNKIEALGLKAMYGQDIYFWNDTYDSDFLGYMAALLRDENFMRDNDAWII